MLRRTGQNNKTAHRIEDEMYARECQWVGYADVASTCPSDLPGRTAIIAFLIDVLQVSFNIIDHSTA
jgi:hypothetical protein